MAKSLDQVIQTEIKQSYGELAMGLLRQSPRLGLGIGMGILGVNFYDDFRTRGLDSIITKNDIYSLALGIGFMYFGVRMTFKGIINSKQYRRIRHN